MELQVFFYFNRKCQKYATKDSINKKGAGKKLWKVEFFPSLVNLFSRAHLDLQSCFQSSSLSLASCVVQIPMVSQVPLEMSFHCHQATALLHLCPMVTSLLGPTVWPLWWAEMSLPVNGHAAFQGRCNISAAQILSLWAWMLNKMKLKQVKKPTICPCHSSQNLMTGSWMSDVTQKTISLNYQDHTYQREGTTN